MAFGIASLLLNGTADMNTFIGTRVDTFHTGDKLRMIAVGNGANRDFDNSIVLVKSAIGHELYIEVIAGYRVGTTMNWTVDNINWSAVAALDWDE